MILNDKQIKDYCISNTPMITPFIERMVRGNEGSRKLSYGVGSFGYDVILDRDVRIFHNHHGVIVDPKRFDDQGLLVEGKIFTDQDGSEYTILPPNSYLLGKTIERFDIPRNIQVIVVGKSTYARSGVLVNVTPIEAGFQGNVVIEIANGTPSPVKIYVNEGIAQFFFLEGEPCETSYADRGGKYQGQSGIQLPLV